MTTYEKTCLLDTIDDLENEYDEDMEMLALEKYIYRIFETMRYEIERMN